MYALIQPEIMMMGKPIVVDVSGTPFEVSSPLYWVECPPNVVPKIWIYDPISGQFIGPDGE
jgi:hypothetical protein